MQYRQGDVFIELVSQETDFNSEQYEILPRDQKEAVILAYGESTGHKHQIKSDKCLLVRDKKTNKIFLMILEESILQHEEHSEIKLPIGKTEVIIQKEYTPEEIRNVAD